MSDTSPEPGSATRMRASRPGRGRRGRTRLAVVVAIVVLAGLLVGGAAYGWTAHAAAEQAAARGPRAIGAGVQVSGPSIPESIRATAQRGVGAPLHRLGSLGPVVHVTAAGPVRGTVVLRFTLTRRVRPEEGTVLVATREHDSGPWTFLRATVTRDHRHATVRTTHLSAWWSFLVSAGDVLKAMKEEIGDGLTGGATTEAEKPHCADESGARSDGYGVTSSAKDTLYWCFGRADGKRVLKVVNRRRYPLTIHHPGLTERSVDNGPAGAAQLARLTEHHATVLMPFGTATYTVTDLERGHTAGLRTEFDGLAQSLYQLQFGLTTLGSILTRFGAGGGLIVNGAVKKTAFDRTAAVMNDRLGDAACFDAVLHGKAGDMIAACLSPADVADSFGPAGLIVAPFMVAGPVVAYFRSELNALGDQFNGRDQYVVIIERAASVDVLAAATRAAERYAAGNQLAVGHTGRNTFTVSGDGYVSHFAVKCPSTGQTAGWTVVCEADDHDGRLEPIFVAVRASTTSADALESYAMSGDDATFCNDRPSWVRNALAEDEPGLCVSP